MRLYEWEIWHTFTAFVTDPLPDLSEVAHRLVASGLAECAFQSSGAFHWISDDKVKRCDVALTVSPDHERAEFHAEFPNDNAFAAEGLFQAMTFHFSELRFTFDGAAFPAPYVRAFLGECRVSSGGYQSILYPTLKVYSTGVMHVELRVMSPDKPVSVSSFIRRYLNLGQRTFDRILAPPAVTLLTSPPAWPESRSFGLVQRWGFVRAGQAIQERLRGQIVTDSTGDFRFQFLELGATATETVASLSSSALNPSGATLDNLGHSIINAVSVALIPSRSLLAELLRGRDCARIGQHWSFRPHIHIVRHERQEFNARRNEEIHGGEFGWILAGVAGKDPAQGRQFLPENRRLFSDSSVYLTRQATLWVWSASGLQSQKQHADANRGHLVYEQQVKAELIDYGYMLHRQLVADAAEARTLDRVVRLQRELILLEDAMVHSSRFGEVQDLLDEGWRHLGVDRLRAQLKELLAVQETATSTTERRRTEKLITLLTIVFGLGMAPSLAEAITIPLWGVFCWWRPKSDDWFALMTTLVTLIILGGVLWLLHIALVRRMRER